MSGENASTLKLMALGRPFQLGMLYDVRKVELIPGITLWDPKVLKDNIHSDENNRKTSYKVSTEDTLEEKSTMLGISAELKLSVLSGLVEVSGSAEYINDRKKSSHIERVTLQYSTTTRFDQLTMAHLGEGNMKHSQIFGKQVATHVVTGITYGADAFFLFEKSVSNQDDRKEIHGTLKAALNKIPKVEISGSFQLDLTAKEKQVTDKLECQFYGDFNLESNPGTFEEAVQLYRKLPLLLGQDSKKAVAKQIWLSPLHLWDNSAAKLVRHISNSLVSKSMQLIEELYQCKIKGKDLKNSLSNKMVSYQAKQLSTFGSRIDEFENDMKRKLMEILPKMRDGTTEETKLADLFKQVDRSPFNIEKLEDWLEAKTEEIQIITNFANDLKKVQNIDLSKSLLDVQSTLDNKFFFCLVLHVVDRNDLFLSEMSQYLQDDTYNQKHENPTVDYWFRQDDIFQSSRQNTILFIKVAEANKDNNNCQFIVDEQFSDKFENKKGISIISYRNGIRTNLKMTSEPKKIRATVMEDRSVKIDWSKPEFGSENIEKYEIYGQENSNNRWDLLSTPTNTTESTTISRLVGKYQFKIRGITSYGVTPDSDISNEIRKYYFSLVTVNKILTIAIGIPVFCLFKMTTKYLNFLHYSCNRYTL